VTVVGDNLKRYRKAFGHSQHALARLSGVHQPIISYVEGGKHEPEIKTVRKLARAMGLPVSALVDEAPQGPPPPKTPRTDEAEPEFAREFEALSGDRASELRAEIDREYEALAGYVRRLAAEIRADRAAGEAPQAGEDFAVKLAKAKLERCSRRLSAVTLLATDILFEHERKTYDEYAGVYGNFEKWWAEMEEQDRLASSGEASGASA
jgi:transcriptional regulator with XRE-family HTH domain